MARPGPILRRPDRRGYTGDHFSKFGLIAARFHMPKPLVVSCPRCATQVVWGPDALFRPFCSERCKMGDLGAWAMEKFRVPDTGEGGPEEPGDEPL